MISGYSIYLLAGLGALIVLTSISGMRVIPLPSTRSLRLYVVLRSLFAHFAFATAAWLAHRQLAMGIYLLACCTYEVLLLAYYSHFHYIPSLRLVVAIRREAIVVSKELLTGGFLLLEAGILAVYGLIFGVLHYIYADVTGEYLNAILLSTAPATVTGYILVLAIGIATTLRTNQASIGQLFSYHNVLKIFGPFTWQVLYSFAKTERHQYNRALPSVRLANRHPARKRDLIFVQLESVGSPMVGAVHAGQPVMPNLAKLAERSLFFPEMVSAKGRGGTSDVELAMFTGRMHSSADAPILDEYYDYSSSVFRTLGATGYRTFAFHGNTGAFFKRSYAYGKMDVEFYDQRRMKLPDAGWGASDGDVLRYARDALATESGPVAAAIILMTSHTPFTNIDKILPADDPRDTGMYERYCRSLRYVDREVMSFIEAYQSRKRDAVFVVYGDHGARVPGQKVNSTIAHADGKRDAVPGWIYFEGCEPRVVPNQITLPTFSLLSLDQLGAGLEICSEGSDPAHLLKTT